MHRILWKVPERWRTIGLADRPLFYPGLYLRRAGYNVQFCRNVASNALDRAEAFVLVLDSAPGPGDQDIIRAATKRQAPVLIVPARKLAREVVTALAQAPALVVAGGDPGPLRTPPLLSALPSVEIQACAARAAEDELLLADLEISGPHSAVAPTREYLFIAADNEEALVQIAPAVRRAAERARLDLVIAASEPDRIRLERFDLPNAWMVAADSPDALVLLAGARVALCAHPRLPATSPAPATWVRTALFHGVAVVTASHPSIDGLAHLCVLDDWDRGLELYLSHREAALMAAARGQMFLADLLRPGKIEDAWASALKTAAELKPRGLAARARPRPVLLALFDLSQDLEVLLPIVCALRERGAVELRLMVTDWLKSESPRTIAALDAEGFAYEFVDRSAVRRRLAPELDGVDGVLTASDTSAGPHRSAHGLAIRAVAQGLAAFTLQHGFENIGLTYRDRASGGDIVFASDTIFIWGAPETLPDWVPAETRVKIKPLGSPKATPPPATRLRISDRSWRRTIGVFENLHWDRFDDAYRRHFLEDLTAAAEADADVLFLVKPHHAGRWLSKNPEALRQTDNLKILDPADPAWQPYTAPVLLASMDAAITTPSTVAIDAARAGRPVAVTGYGLDLQVYSPLPILGSAPDWRAFLDEPPTAAVWRNERFLDRVLLPGKADHRIAARIDQRLLNAKRDVRVAIVAQA